MDDRTFDQQTASEWINIIENRGNSIRENDIYPRLNSWIRKILPSTVLDIGGGQGICSDKIELHNGSYTGVEPSLFLLNRAKQLYSSKNSFFTWQCLSVATSKRNY